MALNLPGDPTPRPGSPPRVAGVPPGSTGFSALLRPLLPDGPWEHRLLHARRTRFHVALAGHRNPGPLLLVLPDIGRTWWSWRRVLPLLAGSGHRVAALDPRGVGATDKTPHGYRPDDRLEDVLAVAT
uniref:alpha/beta fold hydrolase n=1 Tax=Desertihabitans aurantiacus TaxID=2282477 RepID=UPI001E5FFA8B